jgi:nitroreductase
MEENFVLKTIYHRRSIRKFKNEPVPKEDIIKIIDAARWAPSGSNRQPWKFIAVSKKEIIDEMAAAVKNRLQEISDKIKSERARRELEAYGEFCIVFENAPMVIAVLSCPYDSTFTRLLSRYGMENEAGERKLADAGYFSVGAAIENMLLAAESLGYGSCWMTGPLITQQKLEEILDVQEPWHIVSLVPIGKSAQEIPSRPRKEIEEILEFIE